MSLSAGSQDRVRFLYYSMACLLLWFGIQPLISESGKVQCACFPYLFVDRKILSAANKIAEYSQVSEQ